MLILVDMDGVLADFALGFDRAWQQLRADEPHLPFVPAVDGASFYLREGYPRAVHGRVTATQQAPGFVAGLPPVPGAVAGMHALAAAGHEVRICSAPMSAYRNCVGEKYQWVEQHLGPHWVRHVILTKDKTLVAGDVLLDDKPDVTGALRPSWQHVRFARRYNEGAPGPRLTWQTFGPWVAHLRAGGAPSVLDRPAGEPGA